MGEETPPFCLGENPTDESLKIKTKQKIKGGDLMIQRCHKENEGLGALVVSKDNSKVMITPHAAKRLRERCGINDASDKQMMKVVLNLVQICNKMQLHQFAKEAGTKVFLIHERRTLNVYIVQLQSKEIRLITAHNESKEWYKNSWKDTYEIYF